MEIVEILSLVCCVVNLILLVVVLVKQGKSGNTDKLENDIQSVSRQTELLEKEYKTQSDVIMGSVSRLNDSVVNSISKLGGDLRASQEQQQKAVNEKLLRLESEFNRISGELLASLEKIRQSNTESIEKQRSDNQKNLDKMTDTIAQRLQKLEEQFVKINTDLTASLEKVRASNTESMEKLRTENRESLDKINDTVNEKLQKTLNDRLTQSFSAVNERLEQVHKGLGEMKSVASGVTDLKNVLSNVKTRGTLGEIQLGAILEEILAPGQYSAQQAVKPGSSEKVDYTVNLPGEEKGEYVYLPIDSKFPQDRFSALLDAYDSGDTALLNQRRGELEAEIKRCAKSIHDKYIVPPYTTDFAIMFLPFEGLYAEVINMGLVETLQHNFKVNIAGPSTMAAMLNSLQMGFRTLAIQKKSGEVWKILEATKKEFGNFGTVLDSARKRLRQADDDLDKLIGTRSRAISRSLKGVETLDTSLDTNTILGLADGFDDADDSED